MDIVYLSLEALTKPVHLIYEHFKLTEHFKGFFAFVVNSV